MSRQKTTKRVKKTGSSQQDLPCYVTRRRILLSLMGLFFVAALAQAIDQQILQTGFLKEQGQKRFLRRVEIPAIRGMIMDRQGAPMAISTPVQSIWANPRKIGADARELAPLAKILGMDLDKLRRRLAAHSERGFVYLKRRVSPDVAAEVRALDLPAISLQQEYKRFYPAGETSAHIIGFTDVDDQGQEGLELAFNQRLQGSAGEKLVIKDALSRVIGDVEQIKPAQPGENIILSLDRRVQYLAYRELKAAVQKNKAHAASAVVLDVTTGEVLAMVNQPSYNPNGNRSGRGGRLRNRALTDVFEPGSTIKPFTVVAALMSGRYQPHTLIDTHPGSMRLGSFTVRDTRDHGVIDVATVITKSSNVGASKIALNLDYNSLTDVLAKVGMDDVSGSHFPGEAAGQLPDLKPYSKVDRAALAYGYGLSVTTLQLAQAYSVLATDGLMRPVSLLRKDKPVEGKRVLPANISRTVRDMMETVVSSEGTAPLAAVEGYRIAGKTGTVKKSHQGGYSEHHYLAIFAGMAPASHPRFVMVVVVDDPQAGPYYGGLVAAPVFSKVMSGTLRLMNVAPDAPATPRLRLADGGSA
ncbi:MAG: penicillin-binding protein 2 [gamma proteobacterium symbiont of Bathyaustriella thionipta]|nr:penicillin-binding protein 2 [gamma proteobacterium symbiont of Bathyaustriella thionipta]